MKKIEPVAMGFTEFNPTCTGRQTATCNNKDQMDKKTREKFKLILNNAKMLVEEKYCVAREYCGPWSDSEQYIKEGEE